MGGLGSDAAIEAADVVLMDDDPRKIALAVKIARRTIHIAHENVVFAIGVKVAVLILATIGLGTMWMAVFADVGVTVLAVLNAMRSLGKNLFFIVKYQNKLYLCNRILIYNTEWLCIKKTF